MPQRQWQMQIFDPAEPHQLMAVKDNKGEQVQTMTYGISLYLIFAISLQLFTLINFFPLCIVCLNNKGFQRTTHSGDFHKKKLLSITQPPLALQPALPVNGDWPLTDMLGDPLPIYGGVTPGALSGSTHAHTLTGMYTCHVL